MFRHHRTLLAVVALAVVTAGAVHLVSAPPVAVTPAVWPGAVAATPSAAPPSLTAATAAPSPSARGDAVPLLPGAMQQLNASTESTATGLWALLRELEVALGSRLGALVAQLEPGR